MILPKTNIFIVVRIVVIVVMLTLIFLMFKTEIRNFFRIENLKKFFKKMEDEENDREINNK